MTVYFRLTLWWRKHRREAWIAAYRKNHGRWPLIGEIPYGH